MRELLIEVAEKYDREAGCGRGVPGQDLLRSVAAREGLSLPEGCVVGGYGGVGGAASAPWIGIFDPEINLKPQRGLYLAYIFSTDLTSVTLTLQQGVSDLEKAIKERKPFLTHLERQAARLHSALPPRIAADWDHRPSLGGRRGSRPESYEVASVVARRYEISEMPPEEVLTRDLHVAASLLQRAAAARQSLRSATDEEMRGGDPSLIDPLAGFKPRSSRGYVANIAANQQRKNQHHEALIEAFGSYIQTRGYRPTNLGVHPKDLLLHQQETDGEGGPEWLVEVKVVDHGNPTAAVRGAVGQLLEYSYFWYRELQLPAPHLLALFTEDILAYAPYLEDQGIASIWRAGDGWAGSPTAVAWGMVD
ncbi:MrcB family domain-containing protein [Streptomyces sp. NPDC058746]|uniref:MrcB family domain-containing protein n=1 Tax=Streptomyces sp. NPDC058746 TaxID=3346622 RepID=UPI0036A3CF5D